MWGMTVDGIAFALKWSAAGGVLGAVAGGGAGLYFLGLEGLVWGLVGGAVLGAVLAMGILLVAGADSSFF